MSVVLIFVCLFLMLVILLQRGRGGGIASAFGGGGGSGAFGAKTGDVFTWITVVVAGIFVVLAVAANYAFDESKSPVAEAPPVAESPVPPSKPELIPIKMGEDGKAVPIDIESLPSGLKGITITPSEGTGEAAPTQTAPPPAPAPTQPPPAAQPPVEKPKEEPATP